MVLSLHQRFELPTRQMRKKSGKDARYSVKRLGHSETDASFYLPTQTGTPENPKFSKELFCRGLDLTAMEFLILRRRAISILYKNELYTKNFKKDKLSKFELDRARRTFQQHSFFNNQPYKVHPKWMDIMVERLLWDTAHWMRHMKEMHQEDGLIPGRVYYKDTWQWGKEAQKLKPTTSKTPLQFLSVEVKTPGLDNAKIFAIRLFTPKSKRDNLQLEHISYQIFWRKIRAHFTIAENSRRYTIAYINAYWGAESIRIYDDVTLRVAIATLHKKGEDTIKFRLVEVYKSYKFNDKASVPDKVFGGDELDEDEIEEVNTEEEWMDGEDVEEEEDVVEHQDPYYESTDEEA
ncbi:hypothetical protein SLS60_008731 [Paraconiothyrium brasiliense]|uniref:Uncharacterized protein n=1 Tax=Paraconiothyrium brasiliense TaxID=300254 RepID=A0ABR3QZ27_9PLEO